MTRVSPFDDGLDATPLDPVGCRDILPRCRRAAPRTGQGRGHLQGWDRHVKTVWIDLDNAPHVLFFSPIIRYLEEDGHRVLVTVRDFGYTEDV